MKRTLDVLVSAFLLLLLSPIIFILVIITMLKLGQPVIFSQKRPGFNNKIFALYKFRSMLVAYGNDGKLLPDPQRLTPFGRLLRSSSLDELPSLWNVLKGDMSLVGPRPLLVEYLSSYNNEQARRHEVKPGITGWAQVNGRNTISWDKKFTLDVWYVDNQNIWLDIKILFMTIKKVFIRDGISAEGEVTMTKFKGNNIT